MEVHCVYCGHRVHHTALLCSLHEINESETFNKSMSCGCVHCETKMDTMNIHCVHNTCPLYSNGLHRTSVDSDGYQRTPVDSDGFQWTPKDFNGVSRDPVSSELRRTPSDSDGLFRQNPTGSDEIVLIPTGVHFITKIFLLEVHQNFPDSDRSSSKSVGFRSEFFEVHRSPSESVGVRRSSSELVGV